MQLHEDQAEREVHVYVFMPSKHFLTHYLICASLAHHK